MIRSTKSKSQLKSTNQLNQLSINQLNQLSTNQLNQLNTNQLSTSITLKSNKKRSGSMTIKRMKSTVPRKRLPKIPQINPKSIKRRKNSTRRQRKLTSKPMMIATNQLRNKTRSFLKKKGRNKIRRRKSMRQRIQRRSTSPKRRSLSMKQIAKMMRKAKVPSIKKKKLNRHHLNNQMR